MGFFENLGRKVEEFKRTAEETAAEEATHACRSCGERLFHDHDECPQCGADAVVARDRDDRGGSAASSDRGGSATGGDSTGESDATEPTETDDHATDVADTGTDAVDTRTDDPDG